MDKRIKNLTEQLKQYPDIPVSNSLFAEFIDILINNHLMHMDQKIKICEARMNQTSWKVSFLMITMGLMVATTLGILGLAITLFLR